MGNTYFDVEFLGASPLQKSEYGLPTPQPTYLSLTFLGPQAIRVLGESNQRKYVKECALALARACGEGASVFSSQDKAIARGDDNLPIPLAQLEAQWAQAFKDLENREEAAAARKRRKWERENEGDCHLGDANDWSDLS